MTTSERANTEATLSACRKQVSRSQSSELRACFYHGERNLYLPLLISFVKSISFSYSTLQPVSLHHPGLKSLYFDHTFHYTIYKSHKGSFMQIFFCKELYKYFVKIDKFGNNIFRLLKTKQSNGIVFFS